MNAPAPLLVINGTRAAILELQAEIAALPQVDMQTLHHFAEGTYTRELRIPAGTVLTGKIHRFSCINILAKGKIHVASDEGGAELEAPQVFVSGPDVKKAGYALTDCVWVNVHPWDGHMSVEQIEEQVIIPESASLPAPTEALCLGEQ